MRKTTTRNAASTGRRRQSGIGLLALLGLFAREATAQQFDQITRLRLPDHTLIYEIDRPNPTSATLRSYSQISVAPGDRFTLSAGGCVQTGGAGARTWKLYAFPSGPKSERYYSGTLRIEGVTPGAGAVRIGAWLNREVTYTGHKRAVLQLGYQDDEYDDNSYDDHDAGTEDQCRNQGPAWLRVTVMPAGHQRSGTAPRYNEVQAKSVHNAYQRSVDLSAMLRSFTIRSLELDIHHSNHLASWPALSNDWYVYHTALLDQGSSCQPFSKCLSILREFDQRNPQHDVITLFIDLKDPFLQGTSQSAEAFDALIAATLPKVFTPQSLSVHCHEAQTFQASVGPSCPWPLLSELRGSFVVVLTGDFADLQQYVQWNPSTRENLATNRLAFVAPGASSATDLADRPYAVFFNLNGDDADTLSLGELITARGFIARAYDLNEEQAWTVAQQNHIAFLATNEVGPGSAPWAETKNSGGWPFHCMFLDCSALTELLP